MTDEFDPKGYLGPDNILAVAENFGRLLDGRDPVDRKRDRTVVKQWCYVAWCLANMLTDQEDLALKVIRAMFKDTPSYSQVHQTKRGKLDGARMVTGALAMSLQKARVSPVKGPGPVKGLVGYLDSVNGMWRTWVQDEHKKPIRRYNFSTKHKDQDDPTVNPVDEINERIACNERNLK